MIDYSKVLSYFSGKSLEKATVALKLLLASEEQGSWVKGASRSVPAALGKSNVIKKTAKEWLDNRRFSSVPAVSRVYYAIAFGDLKNLNLINAFDYETFPQVVKDYIETFTPVAQLIERLDSTKPLPTVTYLGLSPTVTAELERQKAVKVEMCPIEWVRVENVDDKGRKTWHFKGILRWPSNIQHNTGKYDFSDAGNNQCNACGHAIKNPFNWVPLILTDKDGNLKSLWVGRDCARNLFGIDVKGDIDIRL